MKTCFIKKDYSFYLVISGVGYLLLEKLCLLLLLVHGVADTRLLSSPRVSDFWLIFLMLVHTNHVQKIHLVANVFVSVYFECRLFSHFFEK